MTDDLPEIAISDGEVSPPPAKRGRGRPPSLNADGSRRHPIRKGTRTRARADRAPKRDAGQAPTPRATSLKTRVGAQLTMISMVMAVIPPISADALSPVEIEMLADGIDRQCKVSPRFRRYVELAVNASSTGGIVAALGIVVARRAARHEIIPEFIDPVLGRMIGDTAEPIRHEPRAVESDKQSDKDMSDVINVDYDVPFGAPALPVNDEANGNGHVVYDFEHGDLVAPVTT